MYEKAAIAKRSEVHSITTQELEHVAAMELMDGDESVSAIVSASISLWTN